MPKQKDKIKNSNLRYKEEKNFHFSLKFISTGFLVLIFIALIFFASTAKLTKFQVNGVEVELNSQVEEYLQKYNDSNYFFTLSSNVELDVSKNFEGIAIVKVDKKFPNILIANVTKAEVFSKVICKNYSALLNTDLSLTNKIEQPNFSLDKNLENSLTDNLTLENIELTLPTELTNSTSVSSVSMNSISESLTSSKSSSSQNSTNSESIDQRITKFKAGELLKRKRSMYRDFFSEVEKLKLNVGNEKYADLPTLYCFDNLPIVINNFRELFTSRIEILVINQKLIIKAEEKIYIYSLVEDIQIQKIRLENVLAQIAKEKSQYSQIDLRDNKVVVY